MSTILKKGLAIVAGAYFTAYALLSGYAFIDYKINKKKIWDEAPNHLLVKKYSASVNGKKKRLALVGEIHQYTNKEARQASHLIDEYKDIALEGSLSLPKDNVYDKIFSITSPMQYKCYLKGSGRTALNSSFLAALEQRLGKKVFLLEKNDPRDNYGFIQKAGRLSEIVKGYLLAPINYLKGRNEGNISIEEHEKSMIKGRQNNFLYKKINDKREKEMTRNIESILNKDCVNSLVVFVGAYHLEPIAHALETKMKMEKGK